MKAGTFERFKRLDLQKSEIEKYDADLRRNPVFEIIRLPRLLGDVFASHAKSLRRGDAPRAMIQPSIHRHLAP